MMLSILSLLAVSPVENFIVALREAGFTLVLLWLLTLAIVYGLLSHANLPKSVSVRGVIALVAAFMVLLAAAATPAVAFLQNLITASIMIAFGIMMLVVFLEVSGAKKDGKHHILMLHPKAFGIAFVVLVIAVFVGAGAADIINIPSFEFNDTMVAAGLFGVVFLGAIWIMMEEGKSKKE